MATIHDLPTNATVSTGKLTLTAVRIIALKTANKAHRERNDPNKRELRSFNRGYAEAMEAMAYLLGQMTDAPEPTPGMDTLVREAVSDWPAPHIKRYRQTLETLYKLGYRLRDVIDITDDPDSEDAHNFEVETVSPDGGVVSVYCTLTREDIYPDGIEDVHDSADHNGNHVQHESHIAADEMPWELVETSAVKEILGINDPKWNL